MPSQREQRELLITAIADLLDGVRHVAVGASSPIPAAGAMLLRARNEAGGRTPVRISILGSAEHNFFTNGAVEVFDCAAQGRIDAFFLGGGQIDGSGNINLVGTGDYSQSQVRWPGSFGSAYLYQLVPRVILFREGHSPRVLVLHVDFTSAAGSARAFGCARCIRPFPPPISATIPALTMIQPMGCQRRQSRMPRHLPCCADGFSTSSPKPIRRSQV